MVRVEQQCLFGSFGFHAALLMLLLLAPKWTSTPPTVQVLTLIPTDLKVTDGDKVGGGNPDARPPAQSPLPKSSPPPIAVPEAKPAPKPEPRKPDPEPDKAEKQEKKPAPLPKARPVPPDPQVKVNPELHSQDVDPAIKKKPKKAIQTADAIHTADAPKKMSREEIAARKREAEEAAEAAEEAAADKRRKARAAQISQLNADRQKMANQIGGAAEAVGKSVSGSTQIEMPGPGGQAYAPYRSYLAAFYKERWRKPTSIAAATAGVTVEVVIARDGRLADWRVVRGSGFRELDQSIKDLIQRYPRLLPLPEGSTDPQRTFKILFTLEADSST
jgi:colicin import membrane protein